jgi:hypothetical protein
MRPKWVWIADALLSSPVIALAIAQPTVAQKPAASAIRVESKQVLVPVGVLSRRHYYEINKPTDPRDLEDESRLQELIAKAKSVPIRGLGIRDFRLFEDGREQTIQSVRFPATAVDQVQDNIGRHYEFTSSGGGRWIYPDIPNDGKIHTVVPFPRYVLTYTPPSAPAGSCHRVKVAVRNHPDAMIFSLTAYCRTELSASDPLRDTKFGQQMEPDLNSGQNGRIPVLLAARAFFGEVADQAYLSVLLEFPYKLIRYQQSGVLEETIGMLGTVEPDGGGQALRFSDFACCQNRHGMDFGGEFVDAPGDQADTVEAPKGYGTQVSLPPGEYRLRVVVSDGAASDIAGFERGSDFGRAEASVAVPAIDAQHLALSDIALAKRFRPASPPPQNPAANTPSTYIPLVSKGVEYTPTADSTFKKTDAFLFFLQLYDPFISTDSTCKQFAPAPQPAQPISRSVETSAASNSVAPAAATNSTAATTPPQCLPQAQINLRIVDAKSGAVVRNLDPLNAAEFAIPGNPIIPIGSGIHIDDLPPGQYRLEAQAVQLPSPAPASLNAPPPARPQTTPWHSASFSIQ